MADAIDNEIKVDADEDLSPIDLAIQDGDTPAAVVEPEEGIEKLRAQLAAERARGDASETALAAERSRAADAARTATSAQATVHAQNLATVKTAMDRVKEKGEQLEQAYAEHAAAGDWSNAAKVQREMARGEATLLELDKTLHNLEKAPARPAETDRVEQLAGQMPPKSAAWVRAHPDFVRDNNKYAQMLAAHNLAIGRGHTAESDAYFSTVETLLGLRDAAPARTEAVPAAAGGSEDDVAATQAAGGRSVSPAAPPVTRQGAPGAPRPGSIRLTPAQREAAELSGLSEAEYGAQLARARANKEIQ